MLEKALIHPDVPKRRRVPGRTLMLVALAALVLFFIGKPLFLSLKSQRFYEFPSRELFINETDITRVANRSDVVQPLVGVNDTFDIAVTVWQLATQNEKVDQLSQAKPTEGTSLSEPEFYIGPTATPEEEAEAAKRHFAYVKWYDGVALLEKTIFSEIVFRGVRLSDTDLHANISFQIPTEIFHNHPANNFALRASFVILPRSPSPLDHLKSYTSWFPDIIDRGRFRSFPFPLNLPTEFYRRPRDEVLDAVAITIPLLERHAVPHMCPRPVVDPMQEEYGGNKLDAVDDKILETHPHIVTRTHLRIVRESRLFRRQEYLDMHNRLRIISCGQLQRKVLPSLHSCHKSYMRNGNWEVMAQLAVPDAEAEGGFREESAYAPYMDVLPNVAGPKDVIPVPITREFCDVYGDDIPSSGSMNRTILDYMNITWRLSYSSVTPLRFLLGDTLLFPAQRSNYTDSEWARAMKHDRAETLASLHGYRHHPDSHPLRRLVRNVISSLSSLLLLLLSCTYWATRRSTAYLSIPGTLCRIAGDLIGAALQSPQNRAGPEKVNQLVMMLLFLELPRPLFMLKAILRVRVGRNGLRLVPATHQERASARLDARTDWRWKCGIFVAIWLTHYTLDLHNRFIVTPIWPSYNADDLLPVPLFKSIETLIVALQQSGWITQLILNHRARVFVGRYKASVVLVVFVEALDFAACATWIMGPSEVMRGISYADPLRVGILGVECWQAWRYSSRIPEDEHGEDGDQNMYAGGSRGG